MKSFVFAALATAIAATHVNAEVETNALEARLLGLDKLNLGVDVKLPAGIEISADLGPKNPPPEGCTNVWHPSHPGVDMDGCDNHGDNGWHWVHPCEVCQHQPPHSWTTSTITETCLTTVISCPPEVTNCPGSTTVQTTITIPATTTICPVQVTTTQVPVTSTAAPPPPTWSTEVIPCPTTEPVQPPPVTQQPPTTTGPVVVPPPPAGNQTWTTPPVIVNGANNVQAFGAAGFFGLVAAVLL